MRRFDVLIAGAGPAGAAAALVLAKAGRSVLVLDKAKFPRDKLCAGLLTWKTVRTIARLTGETPEGLMPAGIINHRSWEYRIRHRDRLLSQGRLVYPFHFVERRVFDAWLLSRAGQAGAEVLQGQRVVRADPEKAEVLCASGQGYSGRWLIGADGALSQVRKSFSLCPELWREQQGLGLEVYLDRGQLAGRLGLHEDVLADFPTVYSGFVKAGYSWVFPHRDRLIVGVGGLHRANHQGEFREALREFLDFLGLREDLPVRGHPLPYGNWLERPWQAQALLAGDAAGLVEPLFGEGIHYALRSGEMAGAACLAALAGGEPAGAAYEKALRAEIFPELVYSKYLRTGLYWFVRMGLTRPVRIFLRGGGTKLQEMVHGMRSFCWLRKKS